MKNYFKKVFSMATCCVMSFTSMSSVASATNEKILSDKEVYEIVQDTALEWAIVNGKNHLSIGNVNEVKTSDGSVLYEADYYYNALPYGYAVVTLIDDEFVVKQSNINVGVESLYTELVDTVMENTDYSRSDIDIDQTVIEISPFHYGVVVESDNDTEIIDNYGESLDYQSTKYNNTGSIYISSDKWTSSKYRVVKSSYLKKYVQRPYLFSDDKVKQVTSKYACGIQALLQVAYLEDIVDYSDAEIKNTYNVLWKYTNTSTYEVDKTYGISYGSTVFSDLVSGFKKFATEYYNYKLKYGKKSSPSIKWIKNKIEDNYSVILGYGINVGGERSGHCITVLGYIEAIKVSSGNTWNYIMVYDGWYSTPSYINYDCVDFMDYNAAYFNATKK